MGNAEVILLEDKGRDVEKGSKIKVTLEGVYVEDKAKALSHCLVASWVKLQWSSLVISWSRGLGKTTVGIEM